LLRLYKPPLLAAAAHHRSPNETAMSLKVNEIFHSIQGESLHAGRPCIFLRLTGCNLRCRYCDTRYAFEEGQVMEMAAIVAQIRRFDCRLVELTGGEPLLQPGALDLITDLLDRGYEVLLETNGSRPIEGVDPRCVRIMDIKCPGSGESERMHWDNLLHLSPKDQLKFVIGDRIDYDYAVAAAQRKPAALPWDHLLFSPLVDRLPPRELAAWMLAEGLAARLHLQLHPIIWPGVERGV
jgi:7-carboxy-7-deazaguanine synthase